MAKREKSVEELDRELAALEEELKALQSGSPKAKKAAAPAPSEPAAEAPKKGLLGRFARKDEAPALAPVATADAPGASSEGAYRWVREGRTSRRLAAGDVAPVRIVRVLDRDGRVVSEAAAPEPEAAPGVGALAARVPSLFKRKRSGGGDG